MLRRLLTISLTALALVLVVAPAAHAQDGNGDFDPDGDERCAYDTNVQVSVPSGGNALVITGTNFPPNFDADYEIYNAGTTTNPVQAGTVTTGPDGSFAVTSGPLTPGSFYDVLVHCSSSTLPFPNVEVPPTVNPTTGTIPPTQVVRGGTLSYTGSGTVPMVRLAMVLLAAGGVAVYATRKRQRRAHSFRT